MARAILAPPTLTSTDGIPPILQVPLEVLGRCATRTINEVRGVNRVVYDVTSKPPGTMAARPKPFSLLTGCVSSPPESGGSMAERVGER